MQMVYKTEKSLYLFMKSFDPLHEAVSRQ